MQSTEKCVSHRNLLQALPLIPKYLNRRRALLPDEASSALLCNGESKAVEEPSGAFAGLPAEVWSVIFEKLCPASISFIISPSVIAWDISHAQLTCRKFYITGPSAWRSLERLVLAEADEFDTSQATNWTATRELQELELKRLGEVRSWTMGHRRRFSAEQIELLQQDVSWEDILSKLQLYSQEGLDKADLCKAMQPFQPKSAALHLYLILRDAAQHVFGLQHPCAVSAVILLAVKQEKASAATEICNYTTDVRDVKSAIQVICTRLTLLADQHMGKSQSKTMPSAFDFRRLLYSNACSIEDLLSLAADMRRANPTAYKGRLCGCGQSGLPSCEYKCCQLCCPGPCKRHKKMQMYVHQPSLCSHPAGSSNMSSLKRNPEVEYHVMPPEAFSVKQSRTVM